MVVSSPESDVLLWRLDQVSLSWPGGVRLAGIDLDIPTGITAIMGYSGAGKTSLLNLLVGYESPDTGSIQGNQAEPDSESLNLFWVPHTMGLWPQYTVREHLSLVSPEAQTQQVVIEELISAFGLTEVSAKYPGQLSQGEASRLSVARALASQAKVLVMDEPLVHVDQAHWPAYWDYIRQHCESRQISLIFSTHAPELVLREAQQVICLDQGEIVYNGPVAELYCSPPTVKAASYLGPVNEVSVEGRDADSPQLVRPEQVELILDETGPYVVQQTHFLGTMEEVRTVYQETGVDQTFFHRPVQPRLEVGKRISVRLLILFCCLWLCGGCITGEAPELSFSEITQWPVPAEGIKVPAPRSLNVGPDDELYVLDNAGRVLVYDANDQLVKQWEMPDFDVGKPEGVCLLRNGEIAVADTHYHRVVFFDKQGKVLRMLGEFGEGPSQFIYPVSVVQDPDGDIYVCEYGNHDRVQKFSETGEYLLEFGKVGTGPGEFQRPAGMIWHDGKIYVSDAINNRIQVFSDEGEFLEILGAKTGGIPLYYPYDIAIDRNTSELYIVEYGSGRITKTDLQGNILGRFGKTGMQQGEFLTPWGLTVNSKDQVFVADTGNRLIVKLIP
ncbi:Sulfate/thiosulfate import ATP-binding protein CysA [Gimesia panareensis]|uniref:Sulfate/thiosulfate import ATP-binding protein CysA n=1 Tax=Gimesia panareensis TaxID=2527978 RepID=A0A518FIF0_9PLAN|nr:ATP-binding cassette domain-containing protein [Gimesia panareensis]QDV16127.1 Sulfate/thiosulfate import ATP-binding protein CysA [Gimesia panareensis]